MEVYVEESSKGMEEVGYGLQTPVGGDIVEVGAPARYSLIVPSPFSYHT